MDSKQSRWQGLWLRVVLTLILAASFLAYLQPGFVLDLANRLILCF